MLALTWAQLSALANSTSAEPPTEWIDSATGHRVIRLSREPGSASLYFHQNAYSADGQKLVIRTPSGLSTVNLKTHEIEQVVTGRVRPLVTGRKTGQIYYINSNTVYAADLDTHAIRTVAKLPSDLEPSANITVNADETMLVGIAVDPHGKAVPRKLPPGTRSGGRLGPRWAQGLPMVLYTIDIKTGAERRIYTSNDWLNHLQCSPTDPKQIMFCHEGPWQLVDRIWTMRTDGTGLKLIHKRTMDGEIAGHEFFGADGKTIWYDLQTPRGLVFWLAGYNLETGERTWYHLQRDEWSVHYNVSPDGKLFAGDGGGPHSVAAPENEKWIYLYHPEQWSRTGLPEANAGLVKVGVLKAERLVDLSKHNYTLEPNVRFTPDGKWVVFRSNMFGPTHVFAVELAKK
ncbi:MAG TPA: oligogalacturonate lyase family protein [Verrucomicrobiae bacterium]|nr:oligogalacturonate lyase family protein [Verrucomicrobiae bacterium]